MAGSSWKADLAIVMHDLLADVRQAARALRVGGAASVVAALALAVGIGANTAVFSVVDAVLLRPLPFAEPDRLVMVFDTKPALSLLRERPSPGNFLDWRERGDAFEGLSLWHTGSATLRGDFDPEVITTAKVTPDFFRVLGVSARLGRVFEGPLAGAVFSVAEQYRGGDRELVISDALWRSRFGADGAIVGRGVSLDGATWRVVGVMPAGFAMPSDETQAWLPWDVRASYLPNDGPGPRFTDGPPRDFRFLNVFGRLRRGLSLDEAQARMDALARSLAEEHPRENQGWGVRLLPLREERVGRSRGPLLAIAGGIGCVMLLACFNAASLQRARAQARSRELAVRVALGIPRSRLLRQILLEGVLLSLLASVLGLALAVLAVAAVAALRPVALPSIAGIELHPRALAFMTLVSLCAGLASGLAPALHGLRRDVVEALGAGSRSAETAAGRQRFRRALVAAEVAVSLALLAGALLCVRSFARLSAVAAGFDAKDVLVLRIALDGASYRGGVRSAEFYKALLSRLRVLPGVAEAGAVTSLPMQDLGFDRPIWRDDDPSERRSGLTADVLMATPGYFRTLRIPLRAGRELSDDDRWGNPRVIAVNETLARRLWPGQDAVGRRLVIDFQAGSYPYEIVAVVGDTRHRGPRREPRRELFIPHAQGPYLAMNVVLRTTSDPRAVERLARQELRGLDPAQPLQRAFLLQDVVAASVASERFTMGLFVGLAGIGVLIAATGLFALLSFLVARRSHELGVRSALGATRRQLAGLVVGESLRLVALGGALGLALAFGLARLMRSQLFGVSTADPAAYVLAVALMLAVAVAAALAPARRASEIDPVRAMRAE